jgi:hypothetical protein
MMARRSRGKRHVMCEIRLVETEDALVALYESLEPDRPIEAYITDSRLAAAAARALQRAQWRSIGLK